MTTVATTSSPWNVDASTAAANRTYVDTAKSKTTGENKLNQTDYLKLMTAQLKYQDPFAPMDNTQMVAQMAQFSQLAGQAEGNASLAAIASSLSGARLSDAANWIGKSMLVKSGTAAPDAAGQYAGQLTLDADAQNVSVDLVDSAGAVVRTVDLGAQKAGTVPFFWNGKDADGKQVSTEPLTISVRGAKPLQTAAWASVVAVQSPSSGTDSKLITTLGKFTPADALTLS